MTDGLTMVAWCPCGAMLSLDERRSYGKLCAHCFQGGERPGGSDDVPVEADWQVATATERGTGERAVVLIASVDGSPIPFVLPPPMAKALAEQLLEAAATLSQ